MLPVHTRKLWESKITFCLKIKRIDWKVKVTHTYLIKYSFYIHIHTFNANLFTLVSSCACVYCVYFFLAGCLLSKTTGYKLMLYLSKDFPLDFGSYLRGFAPAQLPEVLEHRCQNCVKHARFFYANFISLLIHLCASVSVSTKQEPYLYPKYLHAVYYNTSP